MSVRCGNIECKKTVEGKRQYCSLTCRNVYVNKYIRDYSKNTKNQSDKVRIPYEANPKKCIHCGKVLSYKYRRNTFCNNSCKASHTYKGRDRSKNIFSAVGIANILASNAKRKLSISDVFCLYCNNKLNRDNAFFCDRSCQKNYNRIGLDAFIIYKADAAFRFSIKDYPDAFDFSLIEKHGWYKPSNRGDNVAGVSRDHMLSVKQGFQLGVDPILIAHPANCKLMVHSDNISKNKKSSITLDDLLNRIQYWTEKYSLKKG